MKYLKALLLSVFLCLALSGCANFTIVHGGRFELKLSNQSGQDIVVSTNEKEMEELEYPIEDGETESFSVDCTEIYVRTAKEKIVYKLPEEAFFKEPTEASLAWFKPLVYFKLRARIGSDMAISLTDSDGQILVPQTDDFPLIGTPMPQKAGK
jgi:hypothetical protein